MAAKKVGIIDQLFIGSGPKRWRVKLSKTGERQNELLIKLDRATVSLVFLKAKMRIKVIAIKEREAKL